MSLRTQKKRQAKADILAATEQLLASRGFEATTMRDIAAGANISYQTLYNYFPSKALIIQSLLEQEVTACITQLEHLLENEGDDLLCKLRDGIGIRFAVVAKQDRALWLEVTVDTFRQRAQNKALYQGIEEATLAWHFSVLDQARSTGELDSAADCGLLARTLYAISEFAFIEYVLNDSLSEAEAMQNVIDQTEMLIRPYLATA